MSLPNVSHHRTEYRRDRTVFLVVLIGTALLAVGKLVMDWMAL